MYKPSKSLLKAFYQSRKHYIQRGKWHRLNMSYNLFYGKKNIEQYFESLLQNKNHLK